MASVRAYPFLFAAICFAVEGYDFVKVKCKDENVGVVGQPSMLECNLELSVEVSEVSIRVIDWKRKGEKPPVLLYNRGIKSGIQGYNFAEPTWKKTLNVSLLITNTAVADHGQFLYFVSTDCGNSKGSTRLNVEAKYSPPKVYSIPEKIINDEDSTLICESGGGYPEGKLQWFDMHGKEWTASSKMEVKQTENGLFQLTSKLSLLRGSTFPKYTCVVLNASGLQEAATTFEQPEPSAHGKDGKDGKDDSAAKIVAPVVVIGSLIVGLLLLLLLRRRRARLARRQSTAPLMNNHHEVSRVEYDVEEGDPQKTDK